LPVTPLGIAAAAVDRAIGESPEFFDDLAEVLGTVSAALGVAATLTFWCPVGRTLGVFALATSGGAALIKTSLYPHDARSERETLRGRGRACRVRCGHHGFGGRARGRVVVAVGSGARLRPALAGQLRSAGPEPARHQITAGPTCGAAARTTRCGSPPQPYRVHGMATMTAAQRTGYLISRGSDGLGCSPASASAGYRIRWSGW
jgi:hypothetical protein